MTTRNGFLGSLLALLAGAGLASAQTYMPGYPPMPAYAPMPGYGYPAPQPYGYAPVPQYPMYPPPQPYAAYPAPQPYPAYPAPQPYRPYPYPPANGMYPTGYAQVPPMPAPMQPLPLPKASAPGPMPPLTEQAPTPSLLQPAPLAAPGPGPLPGQPLEINETPAPHKRPAGPVPPVLESEDVPSLDPVPGMGLYCDERQPPPWIPPHEKNPPNKAPRGYQCYSDFEGLAWWTKRGNLPALVTTGTTADPGATILVGPGNDLDPQERYGLRGVLGSWLNSCQTVGVEMGGFWLAPRSPSAAFGSPAYPVLARPFNNVADQQQSFTFVAFPGVQDGAIQVLRNEMLWGAEANMRFEMCRTPCFHLDMLVGYRFIDFEEDVIIDDRTRFSPSLEDLRVPEVQSFDSFGTRNMFNGAQVGLEGEVQYGRFLLNMRGKVAVGRLEEIADINGTTVVILNDGTKVSAPAGLLARDTNSGHYSRNEIAYVPEFGINVGYKLTPNLRVTAGYTVLYINRVLRAGDQIDPSINFLQNGDTRPKFDFKETEYWSQGFNFGFEFRY